MKEAPDIRNRALVRRANGGALFLADFELTKEFGIYTAVSWAVPPTCSCSNACQASPIRRACMNNMMLQTQDTSKNITKMSASLETSSPIIAKAIFDRVSDALYAEEAIYKAKRLYREEIVIAWNRLNFALTKYATVT
jgi:hypothetical protein